MSRLGRWLVVLGILLWLGWESFFIVDETELAIVMQMGQFRRSIMRPGLQFKVPLLQQAEKMESRILVSDTPPAEFLTLDKKRLVADPITRWKIKDPLLFYMKLADETRARSRIDDIVNSELRREFATHDFANIIGNARSPMMEQVTLNTRVQTKDFGIFVIDIRIRRADLPPEVQDSVFQRMRAERDRVAKKYRSEGEEEAAKIRADTDKEKTILLAEAYRQSQKLRGEGDALSTAIYAAAYGKDTEFYSFFRTLETYEKSLGSDSTFVLSSGDGLFRYFVESGKKP
jgi:modulator of FtsH protease HflC